MLAPEAIAYIAHDLGQTPTMIRKATHFLMTQYEGEPGVELSRRLRGAGAGALLGRRLKILV